MNISLENTDNLNAVITIDINKEDYQPKVDKVLKDYRKTANIPGFRKGHVPIGLIRKQFGKSVMVDEVNKLLQESLSNYIVEEKLDILGQPLPKPQEEFDWDKEDYQFEFELGLTPSFEINLNPKKAITHYQIEADEEFLDEHVDTIRKQFGKMVSQTEVKEGYRVVGTFVNEEKEINKEAIITTEDLKSKKDIKLLLGAGVNDAITFNTKSLFKAEDGITKFLGVPAEEAEGLTIEVQFTITEINEEVPANLDEDLFLKVYPNEDIKTEEQLRAKFKEEAESHFASQSDQQLLNDVSDYLIENIKFDLPGDFLQKWLQVSGEKELTEEEAKEQFEKSENSFRFQLIEQKIVSDNTLQVNLEEIKEELRNRIKLQMAQFGGGFELPDEQLDSFVQNMLQKEEEVRNVSDQIMNKKIIDFYKKNVNLKVKKVNYKKFIDEVYK